MKDNNQHLLQQLSIDNIKCKQKKITLSYLKDYGYYRLINCYGYYLKSVLNNKKINSKQIINFFEFDKKLSNMIAYYIFEFEQKFNHIAIDEVFKYNKLPENYILTITNNPAYTNLRNKGYLDFTKDIYENIKSCNLINEKQYDNNPKNIPLRLLSLSWSFHTLISFVFLQDEQVIKNIVAEFKITPNLYNEFISMCHSIRKFRNTLSHNGMCISSYLTYYCREFNQILNNVFNTNYKLDSIIDLKKLIKILEYLLGVKIINKDLNKLIKTYKINPKLVKKII